MSDSDDTDACEMELCASDPWGTQLRCLCTHMLLWHHLCLSTENISPLCETMVNRKQLLPRKYHIKTLNVMLEFTNASDFVIGFKTKDLLDPNNLSEPQRNWITLKLSYSIDVKTYEIKTRTEYNLFKSITCDARVKHRQETLTLQ